MLEEKRPGLYETKMATVLQTEEKWKRTKVKKRQMFHCGILPSKNLFEAKCVSQSLSTCPRHTNLSSRAGERENSCGNAGHSM